MIDELNKNIKAYSNFKIKTNNRKLIEKFGISRGLIINETPVIKRLALWNEMQKVIENIKN